MNPETIMENHKVTNEDLCIHYESHDYLSRTGSEAKLKKIPLETRQKIAEFYKECRKNGIFPGKPEGFQMTFKKLISYEQMMETIHKDHNRAPASLAAMEPPPNKHEHKVFQEALKIVKKGEIKFNPED